jgi:hypothetical protein
VIKAHRSTVIQNLSFKEQSHLFIPDIFNIGYNEQANLTGPLMIILTVCYCRLICVTI